MTTVTFKKGRYVSRVMHFNTTPEKAKMLADMHRRKGERVVIEDNQ